jgi:hypothetical protein
MAHCQEWCSAVHSDRPVLDRSVLDHSVLDHSVVPMS